jgi:hypothetical protein
VAAAGLQGIQLAARLGGLLTRKVTIALATQVAVVVVMWFPVVEAVAAV